MHKIFFTLLFVAGSFQLLAQDRVQHQLDSLIQTFQKPNSPGLSLAVIQDKQLLYSNQVGLANLEFEAPINTETIFSLASITKQFTAACIGVLEKEGKLSLEDKVSKYIPELPNYGKSIQIKHLLNHTSGLRSHNVLLNLQGFDYAHQGYTNESIQELIFKQKGVNHPAGEKILYNNSNYVLLALIVERISGMSLNTFAEKYLFQPTQMDQTFFQKNHFDIVKQKAYEYYPYKNGYRQHKSLSLCNGAGGIYAPLSDLVKWVKIYMEPAHPLAYLKPFLITQDTLNDGSLSAYARGVFVSKYRGYSTIHHSGRGWGLRTQMICVPEQNLAVIIMANAASINATEISYEVLDFFLKAETTTQDSEKAYTHKATEIEALCGDYQEINSDLTMRIFLENDTLKSQVNQGAYIIPLKSKSRYSFQRLNDASIVYTFMPNSPKKPHLIVDFGGAAFYLERVKLIDPQLIELSDYEGRFYSEELDITYHLKISEGNLYLSYKNNLDILLRPGQKDEFGSGRRTRYTFTRNSNDEINGFSVASEGTVTGIKFTKK